MKHAILVCVIALFFVLPAFADLYIPAGGGGSSGGGGIAYQQIVSSTSAAVNTGYITNSSSLVILTLPATAKVGAVISVVGQGSGGWQLAQTSGQSINFGNIVTTTGTAGFLSSNNQYDCVQVVCVTANTQFVVINSIGNITFN